MSKTLLVAQREYLENVRTKTFWIGILIVPILIVISIGAQRLFAKSKDVRTYAVLDRSKGQWFSKAIDQRIKEESALSVFDGFKFSDPRNSELVFAEFKAQLAKQKDPRFEGLAMLGDKELRQLASVAALVSQKQVRAALEAMTGSLPEKAREELDRANKSLTKSKFQRVDVGNLGENPERKLGEKLARDELFAYFVIGADPVTVGSKDHRYFSKNLTDSELKDWYARHATQVVREKRVANLREQRGLTNDEAQSLQLEFVFPESSVTATGEQKEVTGAEKAEKWAPVVFLYFLWIAVFTAAQMLLTNTIEEKSNRLIEVLLSSISPMQLMAGKVVGIGATGLTIVAFWVLCAFFGAKYGMSLVAGQSVNLDLGAVVTNPRLLFSFVAYFLGGYLLYAAVLVGIGSVCNSLKEAQNLMQPVFICLMVPLLAMVFVTQDPNGTMARVLTYVPMFTPFLMMNRAGGPPPMWEYVASTALIVVSIAVAFWAAAKVFRIGILMTGKPPKIREILQWLKAPVGAVPETKRA